MENLSWQEAEITGYDERKKKIRYLTGIALWGAEGFKPLPIQWVLVIDPTGEMDPLPLMSTDFDLTATKIIELYVDRWGIEVTFQEAREHLGLETQRQWSDKAIARTTPILMALYSIVCMIGYRLNKKDPVLVEKTAWYNKKAVTFSDLLKASRIELWKENVFFRKDFSDFSVKNQIHDEGMRHSMGVLLAKILAQAA